MLISEMFEVVAASSTPGPAPLELMAQSWPGVDFAICIRNS